MGAGRPPKFKTSEELDVLVNEYMLNCPDTRTVKFSSGSQEISHPTITGLVLYLGFSDRASFYDYEKKPEFTHTIKRARTFIENMYEKNLFDNPTGAIFALKNFGWRDRHEIETTDTKTAKDIDDVIKRIDELTNKA